jgi:hypothetical protein
MRSKSNPEGVTPENLATLEPQSDSSPFRACKLELDNGAPFRHELPVDSLVDLPDEQPCSTSSPSEGRTPPPHILFTFAMRRAPARAIQELARHQDLATTQRYMHLSHAAVEGAIRLLDRWVPSCGRGNMVATGSSDWNNGNR